MNPRTAFPLVATLVLAACVSGGQVQMPAQMSARPQPVAPAPKPVDGAIFAGTAGYRPLFEDRRARFVGDTIVVTINERLSANQQSRSSADRSGSTSFSLPLIKGVPGKSFQGAGVTGSSDTSFEGKGETSNSNVFTGTITTTVIEVLANGNLVVAGDKQIGINHNSEFIRFSGVVTPAMIQIGNTVSSTQVADVRLEYIGRGYIDQAQAMPWLQRVFLSVLPF
jgi:flagellar L-ring protein precursor FlgH